MEREEWGGASARIGKALTSGASFEFGKASQMNRDAILSAAYERHGRTSRRGTVRVSQEAVREELGTHGPALKQKSRWVVIVQADS